MPFVFGVSIFVDERSVLVSIFSSLIRRPIICPIFWHFDFPLSKNLLLFRLTEFFYRGFGNLLKCFSTGMQLIVLCSVGSKWFWRLSHKSRFWRSKGIVCNLDLKVWTSFSTNPVEGWSAAVPYMKLMLCESQNGLKTGPLKHDAWSIWTEIEIPWRCIKSVRISITVLNEVLQVIFAEENLKNLSIQSRRYLEWRHEECNGPAKSKKFSSFT